MGYGAGASEMAKTDKAVLATAKACGKRLTFMIVPGQSVYQQGKASFIGISTNIFCNGFPHLPLFFELPRNCCTVFQMAFIVCQARIPRILLPKFSLFNHFYPAAPYFIEIRSRSVVLKRRIN